MCHTRFLVLCFVGIFFQKAFLDFITFAPTQCLFFQKQKKIISISQFCSFSEIKVNNSTGC